MKKIILLIPLFLSMSGCYSYVKTYDGKGHLLAQCESSSVLLGFIPVSFFNKCFGSANPKDISSDKVERGESNSQWVYQNTSGLTK